MRATTTGPLSCRASPLTRRFDATSDLTLTLARGFKPGGYSAFTGRADLTTFDPQTTWGLEAAFSASPRNTNFSYTARAYAYRVKGYQIERSFAVPDTSTDEYLVVNADRARVLGFELESVWRAGHDVTVTLAASVSPRDARGLHRPVHRHQLLGQPGALRPGRQRRRTRGLPTPRPAFSPAPA